jgi:hypothetical protein
MVSSDIHPSCNRPFAPPRQRGSNKLQFIMTAAPCPHDMDFDTHFAVNFALFDPSRRPAIFTRS